MFFQQSFASLLVVLSVAGLSDAFTNPIRNPGGADPQVVYSGGWYYFIATEWDDLKLTRARSIEELKTSEIRTIYTDTNPSRCCNVWAPELHYLDGKWYIYYTAGETGSNNLGGQRYHVLVGMSIVPIVQRSVWPRECSTMY